MTFTLVGSVAGLITSVMTTIGIPGLFALMVVESFGVPPIPSEVILPFAGFLVADGTFNLGVTIAAAVGGGLVGAYAAYAVGRWWRDRMLGLGIGHLRLQPRHLERVDRFFARRGEVMVAVCRLVPIVRSYISYPAGTARMEPVRFGAYTVAGSIPFAVALIYAGMVLRSQWDILTNYFVYLDVPLVALVVFVVGFFLLQIVGVLAPGWPPRRVPSPTGVPVERPEASGRPPGTS